MRYFFSWSGNSPLKKKKTKIIVFCIIFSQVICGDAYPVNFFFFGFLFVHTKLSIYFEPHFVHFLLPLRTRLRERGREIYDVADVSLFLKCSLPPTSMNHKKNPPHFAVCVCGFFLA